MEKVVKGMEKVPENAVKVLVKTEQNKYNSPMHITFKATAPDPQTLDILQRALSTIREHSKFNERFATYTIDGKTYDIRSKWAPPRFDGRSFVFSCWGSPSIAETIAETFEVYLYDIEGLSCYVVPERIGNSL